MATIHDIQFGTVTFAAGDADGIHQVALATTLNDPLKTAVFFSVQPGADSPASGWVYGRVVSSTGGTLTIEFGRVDTTTSIEQTIHYWVVEWSTGVAVQHVSRVGVPAPSVSEVLNPDVALANSFVVLSTKKGGGTYGGDDFTGAYLNDSDADTLADQIVYTTQATANDVTVYAQVITYDNCTVQRGSITGTELASGDASEVITLGTPVASNKSFALIAASMPAGTSANIGQKMVTGRLNASGGGDIDQLIIERDATGVAADRIDWQVVTFTGTELVQRGSAAFGTSDTTVNATLSTAIDTNNSIALLTGLFSRSGRTSYAANDNPDPASFTLQLTSTTNLAITRSANIANTANAEWTVIDFSGDPGTTPVDSDRQMIWNVESSLTPVDSDRQMVWNIEEAVDSDRQMVWNVESESSYLWVKTGKMLDNDEGNATETNYTWRWFYTSTDGITWTPTYTGAGYTAGAQGMLMNFRSANALFEDEGHVSDGTHAYTGLTFDPEANVQNFIAALPDYAAHGVLGVTISMQGGSTGLTISSEDGHDQHMVSAYDASGNLRVGSGTMTAPESGTWPDRAKRVIEAARDNGMIVILSLFYQRNDQIITVDNVNHTQIKHAIDQSCEFLIQNDLRNVIIEIANEYNIAGRFQHDYLYTNSATDGVGAGIRQAQDYFVNNSTWRIPVSSSTTTPASWDDNEAYTVADVALIHLNAVEDFRAVDPHDTATQIQHTLNATDYPVVVNEDDNYTNNDSSNDFANQANLDAEIEACNECFVAGVSWGSMFKQYTQNWQATDGFWQFDITEAAGTSSQEAVYHAVANHIQSLTIQSGTTPVDSDRQMIWNVESSLTPVDSDRQMVWNADAAVDSDRQVIWNVESALTPVDSDRQMIWNVLTPVESNRQMIWNIESALASVDSDRQMIWNVEDTPVSTTGDIQILRVTGSDDSLQSVTGSFEMAQRANMTFPLGSDLIIEMTISGSGSISGYTFRAHIAPEGDPTNSIVTGTPTVYDAANRIVRWVISDSEILPGAGSVPTSSSRSYVWGIWRDNAGSDIPLVHGRAELLVYAGSGG